MKLNVGHTTCKMEKKLLCKIVLLRRNNKWQGFSENAGDRTCEKNQIIFNNKFCQENTLYEMKSCLGNEGKMCRGEMAMRRRDDCMCFRNSME